MRVVAPRWVMGFVASIVLTSTSHSQTLQEAQLEQPGVNEPASRNQWNVSVGPALVERPDYPGASRSETKLAPLFAVTYSDLLFLGAGGLGLNAINSHGWRLGPVLSLEPRREEDDDPRRQGVGDIDRSVTAGLFAAYRFGPFELYGTARQAITHTDNGLHGLVRLDYRLPLIPRKVLVVGPDMDLGNLKYNQTWFGLTPEQSANTGLPAYSPSGGVNDVGLHAAVNLRISEHLLVRTFLQTNRLIGNASRSPLVEDKTQTLAGVGVAYHF
jgi:outer membrane protein